MNTYKGVFTLLVLTAALTAWGDELALTPQEAAVVQAIKAQNASASAPMQAPAEDAGTQPVDEDTIKLSDATKQQAFAEPPSPLPPEPAESTAQTPAPAGQANTQTQTALAGQTQTEA